MASAKTSCPREHMGVPDSEFEQVGSHEEPAGPGYSAHTILHLRHTKCGEEVWHWTIPEYPGRVYRVDGRLAGWNEIR